MHARISLELGICEQGATSQIGNWWETGSAGQTHKTSQPFSHLPLAGHLVPMQAEGGREGCRWRSAAPRLKKIMFKSVLSFGSIPKSRTLASVCQIDMR